jgi:hypothetical protein
MSHMALACLDFANLFAYVEVIGIAPCLGCGAPAHKTIVPLCQACVDKISAELRDGKFLG